MRMIVTLFLIVLLTGCVYTKKIPLDAPPPIFDELNSKLAGKIVSVQMVEGDVLKGKIMKVDRDSLTLVYKNGQDTNAVALTEVEELVQADHAAGFIEGFVWGTFGGAAFGAMMGYLTAEDPAEDCLFYCPSRSDQAVLWGALMGGLAGFGGMLGGAKEGSRHVYLFEQKKRGAADSRKVNQNR